MEIEENVNSGMERGQFSKIPIEYRKNMQSRIVTCDTRRLYVWRKAKTARYRQKQQELG
jgi:hypothetical protein